MHNTNLINLRLYKSLKMQNKKFTILNIKVFPSWPCGHQDIIVNHNEKLFRTIVYIPGYTN
jgi:hypothetical protein